MTNILAVTYWSFREPIFQSGALPYLRIIARTLPKGSTLYVLTLEKDNYNISKEEEEKILTDLHAHNIRLIRKRYYRFGLMALISWSLYLFHLTFICFSKNIRFIHAFGAPAGSIGYLLSKITGKQLILDCFEPHAEAMTENGTWTKESLAFKMQFKFEKLQLQRASAVIAHTLLISEYVKRKHEVLISKLYVRSNFVDFKLFDPANLVPENTRKSLGIAADDIICIYSGKVGGIYLEDELFEFFKTASEYWKNKFKAILLSDISPQALSDYLQKYSIDPNTVSAMLVPHSKVPEYLSAANFAICAVKPIPTKLYCSPIKTGEYWAMGLPVVIPKNIGKDSALIEQEQIGAVLSALNKEEYSLAVSKINSLFNPDKIMSLKEKIISIARKHRGIEAVESIYKEIYS
ncbi:MAG: hypothetical protein EPN85_00605 [Bacteroidetes bacterium]|nr:MAG: hypothetical protein EPN85_00605 [Bacteroidota bacterium]